MQLLGRHRFVQQLQAAGMGFTQALGGGVTRDDQRADVQAAVLAHHLAHRSDGLHTGAVLAQVNEANRYRFDQSCRVKAIKGAAELGLAERLSINFLPNAIYRPEICIRTTLEAARTHGFPLERIIFEVTEGERVEDGPWFASILR